ncbi:hypothetical protein QPK87_24950 [Kamptonema cortianum]|nr:hypothetical protein [Kamptonema cortianum]
MRDRLQEQGAIVNTLTLTPLQLEEIAQLLADALHQDREGVKPLAELVFKKTSGNPFFINEFLKTIYQEQLLVFDRDRQCWQWQIQAIERLGITDNVVDLMIDKLKKLPEATQEALSLAACIGTDFDLGELAQVGQLSPPQMFESLFFGDSVGFDSTQFSPRS